MAYTQTWNASYEAVPANGDDASEGALRIRNLKRDIRERLELDHNMDETDNDGEHLKVTFYAPLGADPANVANKGFLYTKDVSAKVELFWEDEDGNVIQLTSAGAFIAGGYPHVSNDEILIRPDATAGVAAGWSTEAVSDKAIRINSRSTAATADGGSNGFSAALVSALSNAAVAVANHSHGAGTLSGTGALNGPSDAASGGAVQAHNSESVPVSITGSTAAGGAHAHSVQLNVQYRDFRVVSKD